MADRKGFVGVRFDEDTLALIDKHAAASAVSRSVIIRLAVEIYLTDVVGTPKPIPATPVPEPERIPEVEQIIAADGPEVDAAMSRHPAGKRRHDGHRSDTRSGGSCLGCRDCRGWSPIVAGGMRCKCGHPVRMH